MDLYIAWGRLFCRSTHMPHAPPWFSNHEPGTKRQNVTNFIVKKHMIK